MDVAHAQIYRDRLGVDSIRLLRVRWRRGELGQTLECQLATYPIEQCPIYAALSYAWQEPQATEGKMPLNIMLNDQKISTQPNLAHALRHLVHRQESNKSNYFWIDALCINQSLISERTSQVSIMHQIYRNASRVHVWLGPDPDDEVPTVREFFRALLSKYYLEEDFCGSELKAKKYKQDFLHQDDERALALAGLPPTDHNIWKAVVRFWDRAWFCRTWVSQEVALAKHIEFWCGETELQLQELVEISRFHGMSGLGETLLLLKSERPTQSIEGRKVGCNAMGIEDLRMWANGIRFTEAEDFRQAADRLVGPESIMDPQHPLLRIFAVQIFLTFRNEASDPRDKIFALLVLMKQMAGSYDVPEIPLAVDYSKGTDAVYREATAWIIDESQCLGILALLHPRRQVTERDLSHSWVPDFRSPPPCPLLMFEVNMTNYIEKRYELITPDTSPVLHNSQLTVCAKCIGRVEDIGDTYLSMVDDGCFEYSARLLLNCPDTVDGKNRIDVWIDTLSAKAVSVTDRSSQRAAFKHWLAFFILRRISVDYQEGRIARGREHLERMPTFELLAQTDDTDTLPDIAYWSVILAQPHLSGEILNRRPLLETVELAGRRLFRVTSQSGVATKTYLGVGPEEMREGDEVYAVVGSVLPLVLRQTDDNPASPEATVPHQVVGEGYLVDFDDILAGLHNTAWQRLELR